MRRVYAIWFIKQVVPVMVLMPILAVIALWETAEEFFVAKIVENFVVALNQSGFLGVLGFVMSAVKSAPILPILIIGFSTGFFLVLAFRLMRNFKQLTLVRI